MDGRGEASISALVASAVANADKLTDNPRPCDVEAICQLAPKVGWISVHAALSEALGRALDSGELEAVRAAANLRNIVGERMPPATASVPDDKAKPSQDTYYVLDRRGSVNALRFGSVFRSGIDDWEDAESLGLVLMRLLGFADAAKTTGGPDSGIDVTSIRGVCQVKHHAKNVGRGDIQRLGGACRGRVAVFLAQSYSSPAVTWANDVSISLFQFDAGATVRPVNGHAKLLANAAPRIDPMNKRAVSNSQDLRVIRVQQWFGIVAANAGRSMRSPRDERRFAKGLAKVQRRIAPLSGTAPSKRVWNARMNALEAAVSRLAKDFNIPLPS